MALNLFGTKIEVPGLVEDKTLDYLLIQVAKRSSERKILDDFLDDQRLEELEAKAREAAKDEVEDSNGLNKTLLSGFYVEEMKRQRLPNGVSLYHELIYRFLEKENPDYRRYAGLLRKGVKGSHRLLPPDFPSSFKKAESILGGKLRSELGEKEQLEYLTRKEFTTQLRIIAQNLFFGANYGLEKEDLIRFLTVMYELGKIETSQPITPSRLRGLLAESLKNNQPLEIVHIKSLRFTYPGGESLKMLEDTRAATQLGLKGEQRFYPSEEIIFERLTNLRKIFEQVGLRARVTVIVSDPDLDYCFPPGQEFVPLADVSRARVSAGRYLEYLKTNHLKVDNLCSLTEFLEQTSGANKFRSVFSQLVDEGRKGGGATIKPKILEMRVNDQFDHYQQMFGEKYTRGLARQTALAQIANVLSLSVVFSSFSTTPLLVIDSRGFEDQLIGGYQPDSVVKFFTRFKDPTGVI